MNNAKDIPTFIFNLIFLSLLIGSLGLYMSISFIGVSHILLLLPIFYVFKKQKFNHIFNYLPSRFLVAFIISGFISILFNWASINDPFKLIFKLKYFIIGITAIPCYYYILISQKPSKSRASLILKVLLIGATLATCSGIIGLFSGFNPLKFKKACDAYRNCGMSGMLLTYAYSISILCSILVGWIINFKQNEFITKKSLIIVFLINVVGLYLTYSRGAMLGFIISLPFCFFWKNKNLFKYGILAGILLSTAVSYLLVNKIDINYYRFNTNTHNENSRLIIFNTALHTFKDNPIFGVGYRNFENVASSIKQKYGLQNMSKDQAVRTFTGHAHNNYLEVLSGMGIIGFISFIGFMLSWIYMCFTSKDLLLMSLLPGLFNFMFSGLFQSTLIDGEITFLIMALFSLTVMSQIKNNFLKT